MIDYITLIIVLALSSLHIHVGIILHRIVTKIALINPKLEYIFICVFSTVCSTLSLLASILSRYHLPMSGRRRDDGGLVCKQLVIISRWLDETEARCRSDVWHVWFANNLKYYVKNMRLLSSNANALTLHWKWHRRNALLLYRCIKIVSHENMRIKICVKEACIALSNAFLLLPHVQIFTCCDMRPKAS